MARSVRRALTAVWVLALAAASSAQPAIQPFYLERALYERHNTGEPDIVKREIIARRSDGATASIDFDGPPATLRKVAALDGSAIWLLDAFRLKSTWPRMQNDEARTLVRQFAEPRKDCGIDAKRLAGFETASGQKTVVSIEKLGTQRQLKFWLALELGCEMLQLDHTQHRPDGTTRLLSYTRVLQLRTGEPDPKLFDPGDGYTEAPPSQLMARRLGLSAALEPNDRINWQRLDEQYSGAETWIGRLSVKMPDEAQAQSRDVTLMLRLGAPAPSGMLMGTWRGRSDSGAILDVRLTGDDISFGVATGAVPMTRMRFTGTRHADFMHLNVMGVNAETGQEWPLGTCSLQRR